MKRVVVCLLACAPLLGQAPRVGTIDFFGLDRVSESQLRKGLSFAEGDALPASKTAIEERVEAIDGVVLARVTAVCCEAGAVTLFVGIEERGAPHFDLQTPPSGAAILPEELTEFHRSFLEAVEKSARAGDTREDHSRGYALAADPAVRAYQERFMKEAAENYTLLHDVLRNSSDVESRAIAALIVGYASDRKAAATDLQLALRDPDDGVRQNALLSLGGIALFVLRHPDAGVRIAPTWPIEMLHSVYWGDRVGAVDLLLKLTENRDRGSLDQIRERALSPLVEMARWKSLTHALPACLLAGRLGGMSEAQIQEEWSSGNRERIIAAAEAAGSR